MQCNPNPNDPNYRPPMQESSQAIPPYQAAQPVYPNQPGVPPYQGQTGVPPYQVQPGVLDGTPPNQYAVPQTQYAQNQAQKKELARKYGVAKAMDYLQWVLFALEMLFLLRFVLKLLGADHLLSLLLT